MKATYFVFALLLSASMGDLYADCVDGQKASCSVKGKRGTKECISGRWGPCEVPVPEAPPPRTGTATPRYYILAVIYAPPGTKGGGSSSSVTYGSGSTLGTTVGASKSFSKNYRVSATASGGILGNSLQVGTSFSYGRNSTDASSLEITKSRNTEINLPGPGVDGIDHDRDEIWLWLNPKIQLTMTPTSASWTPKDGPTADIQYVHVGHLKNPGLIPAGVLKSLQRNGITPQDYQHIIRADPFAQLPTFAPVESPSTPAIDPARYKSLYTTFPYEPPYAEGDPATTFKTSFFYSTMESTSSSTQKDHTVGVTVEADGNFLPLFKAHMNSDNSWTWTNSSSKGSSTNTNETAAVTVGGPAFGYAGPTDMGVYYDVLYKTFLFAPVTGPIELRGVVTSRSGKNVGGQEVIVKANGRRYRTFTNTRGEYRILEKISGPIQLKAGPVKMRVMRPRANVDIRVP